MLRGIYYNQKPAICSIYESGLMCYNALKLSDKYSLEYCDEPQLQESDYDFTVFNFHHITNNWMLPFVHQCKGPTFTIVTEVGHDSNPMPYTSQSFNYYMILDPTIIDTETIFGFPRPLELATVRKKENNNIVIGSFGLPTPGKNWEEIVTRTQDEFNEALIRFNIPHASYVPMTQREIDRIIYSCNRLIVKPNINLQITNDYMSKEELIDWCSQNTINVFLYNRNQTGMSATTDQAIASGRPILVSKNDAFRHVLQYLHPYPSTIKEAIETTLPAVRQMQKDWSPIQFARKFENIVLGVCNEIQ